VALAARPPCSHVHHSQTHANSAAASDKRSRQHHRLTYTQRVNPLHSGRATNDCARPLLLFQTLRVISGDTSNGEQTVSMPERRMANPQRRVALWRTCADVDGDAAAPTATGPIGWPPGRCRAPRLPCLGPAADVPPAFASLAGPAPDAGDPAAGWMGALRATLTSARKHPKAFA